MKIAIPVAEEKLCMHFGHCQVFHIFQIENNKILGVEKLTPPPHEPGVLPKWLGEQKVNVILAGGMGVKAQQLFAAQNIEVVTGIQGELNPEKLVELYIKDNLTIGQNACSH